MLPAAEEDTLFIDSIDSLFQGVPDEKFVPPQAAADFFATAFS